MRGRSGSAAIAAPPRRACTHVNCVCPLLPAAAPFCVLQKSSRVEAEPVNAWELVEQAAEQMYIEPPSPRLTAMRSAAQAVLVPAAKRLKAQRQGEGSSAGPPMTLVEVAEVLTEQTQLLQQLQQQGQQQGQDVAGMDALAAASASAEAGSEVSV